MTQVTPPGWYPDPGRKSDGPPTERWWDGKAWTDQVRPAGSAGVPGPPEQPPADGSATAHPVYPVHPGYPGQVQPGGRRGLRTGIAVGVAAVVLASIGVGVYALTADDGSNNVGSQQGPGGQGGDGGGQGGPFGGPGGDGGSGGGDGGSGGQSPAPEGSEAPKVDSGSVTDPVSGISIPIPDGWYGQQLTVGAQVASDETYKCPSDTSQECMKGGAYSAPALVHGAKDDTAEEVAKADIAANAEESYGKGYGEITSHEVLASKAVTVAGQKGYLVRWKAVTSKGADGYVESLAFPSPVSERQMVLVRFGVDVTEGQSVLDEIAKGIKVSTGGGNGQDI
ncbi:DUF2510 domain-containing protein [Streptomyces ferrugineus]|uniref:DUF2510 domain-containing protein n=1 Tax=Streptomyces ferrugineus TaxID=1413221 RepID=A0A7M2SFG3_9ACTN|nr:DUF2510 domain-containing protein [Streptomyces ferrugineus]QOV34143.1 DUF2510 domain-containing protein [Streptomyces ferrugineus]